MMAPPPPRPRVELNRTEAGHDLLGAVEGWSGDRRWVESRMGALLFRHPGYVPLLRKRLTVTIEKEAAVRAFMERFPDPDTAFAQEGAPALREWLHSQGISRWHS